MPGSNDFISERWNALTAASDKLLSQQYLDEITTAYSKQSRHYHNLDHIAELLRLSNQFAHALQSKDIVDFAIFYHDIVYKVPGSDNEHKSAVLARERLSHLNVDGQKVALFIEATKTHELVADSMDLRFFLDFDMAVLGSDWPTYEIYLQNIRKEYKFYPDVLYYPGRNAFLKKTLASAHIYHTTQFRASHEAQARQNMQRELDTR